MSARDFLDLLESRGLLDETITADLRRQVGESAKGVTAETIAKLLVENGHLTRFQATKLVGEATEGIEARRAQRAAKLEQDSDTALSADDDLLGEMRSPPPPPAEQVPIVEPEEIIETLESIEQIETLDPIESFRTPGGGTDISEPTSATAGSAGFRKRTLRENRWDGPLMLGGGGLFLLLLFFSIILYYSLTATDPILIYEKGMEDYRNVAYANAKDQFDRFIKKYPKHEYASEVRVRFELCSLRMITDQMRSPEKALEMANEILPKIKDEEAFHKVREELAAILPDIAEGFAKKAKAAATTQEAEEALRNVTAARKLINNKEYVTPNLLGPRGQQLERIEETVTLVRRGLDQEKMLATTLSEISGFIEQGETRDAYIARDKLLQEFPQLEADPRLVEKVQEIGAAEEGTVQQVAGEKRIGEADIAAAPGKRVVLSSSISTGKIRESRANVVFLAGGSLYGMDASSGEVKWQRPVGFETTYHPQRLEATLGSDVIAMDGHNNELLRIEVATGKVAWRLPIGEPFNAPQIWRNRIILSTKSGKVLAVESSDGATEGYADLNQQLSFSPAVVSQRTVMYQVGQNDNLYVLQADSLACTEVYYLAHMRDMVTIPPLVAFGHVFIFEKGPGFSNIHVLKTDANGLKLTPAQPPIRIEGDIVTAPVAERQRLIMATNRGAIRIFDFNGSKKPPMSESILPKGTGDNDSFPPYIAVDKADLWVARAQLTKAQILAAKNELGPPFVGFSGDLFVAPIQLDARTVYHLRRPNGAPGFLAVGSDVAEPGTVHWQSDLSIPVAITVIEPGTGTPLIFSRKGAFFRLDDQALASGYQSQVFAEGQSNVSYTAGFAFGESVALFSPSGRALVYDPARSKSEMRSFHLELPGDSAVMPIAYQGGILVPLSNGQIQLMDIRSGTAKASPFQPTVKAGQKVKWNRPVAVGEGRQFVIADQQKNVYRVGLQEGGAPRLVLAKETQLADQIVTQLAELNNFVFAGARYDNIDVLLSFTAGELQPRPVHELPGQIVWGPFAVGGQVVLATSGDELFGFDGDQKQVWSAKMEHGQPTAEPALIDGDLVIGTAGGAALRINTQSGEVAGVVQVGSPLDGQPFKHAGGLGLLAADGTFHLVEMP
jgi:outer membrane protein assembly factor BamB